jgi:hypothetical protein
MGLCEVSGKARPIEPLNTPFSLMPCVYYEYRVTTLLEESPPPEWTFRIGRNMHRESPGRSRTQCGSSGDVPFLIDDGTGAVEVRPEGAIVDVASRQTFATIPWDGGLIPRGTRVVAREKYIPAGSTIYVMGELTQAGADEAEEAADMAARLRELKADPVRMAACDVNGDGVVDAIEWEAARRRAGDERLLDNLRNTGRSDRPVIARPARGDLFYISERSEKETLRQLSLAMWVCLLAGTLLVVAGILLAPGRPASGWPPGGGS